MVKMHLNVILNIAGLLAIIKVLLVLTNLNGLQFINKYLYTYNYNKVVI